MDLAEDLLYSDTTPEISHGLRDVTADIDTDGTWTKHWSHRGDRDDEAAQRALGIVDGQACLNATRSLEPNHL